MIDRKFYITDALVSLYPSAEWSITGTEYVNLVWLDENNKKPTKKELDAEISRLEIEYKKGLYRLERFKEYPSIGDQLDALFKAGVFPEEMAAQIQAVKDKYPKPE